MDPIQYVLAGILIVLGGFVGWFIRSKVLARQLLHARSKLTDLESLHVNLQNEISLLRQKGREYDDLQRTLDDIQTELTQEKERVGENSRETESLRSQLSESTGEMDMLRNRLGDLEAENDTFSQTSEHLDKENNSLRSKISELNDRIAQLESARNGGPSRGKSLRDRKPKSRVSQSTEKFKKKERPKEDVSSTGIRMLEKIAEEVREPNQFKNETRKS